MHILLIEPYPPLARALAKGLEEEGFAVDIASGKDEGTRKLQEQRYDVLVIDLEPPENKGLELLRSLRNEGATVPALVLTLPGHEANGRADPTLGLWDAVAKPLPLEDLLTRLRALARRVDDKAGEMS